MDIFIIVLFVVAVVVAVIVFHKSGPKAMAKQYAQKVCECQTMEKEYGKEDEAKKCYEELAKYAEDLNKEIEDVFSTEQRAEFEKWERHYSYECEN